MRHGHSCFRRGALLLTVSLLGLLAPVAADGESLAVVQPFGDRPVGYTAFTLESGPDELTPSADDRRRLLVEVWFPAQQAGTKLKPWASESVGESLAKDFPFPRGFHSRVGTHTWIDVKPLTGSVPAIVFSHGLSFPPTLYQSFFEDLASRGYAVFAVSHPHGTVIAYPDGTTLDRSRWPQIEDEDERQRMLARSAEIWAQDLSVVTDAILSGKVPIAVRVAGSEVGLFGHSLGGTAVGKLSGDKRVSGVVAMEGDVRNAEDEKARGTQRVAVPFLHLIGGYNRLELERASYLPSPEAPVFNAVVRGTGHAYFSDLIHFYRAFADHDWLVRHRYELDPDRVIRIACDYIAAFFDWRLKQAAPGALLRRPTYADQVDGPRQGGYPEVDLAIAVE